MQFKIPADLLFITVTHSSRHTSCLINNMDLVDFMYASNPKVIHHHWKQDVYFRQFGFSDYTDHMQSIIDNLCFQADNHISKIAQSNEVDNIDMTVTYDDKSLIRAKNINLQSNYTKIKHCDLDRLVENDMIECSEYRNSKFHIIADRCKSACNFKTYGFLADFSCSSNGGSEYDNPVVLDSIDRFEVAERVINTGVPNYKKARIAIESGLNIGAWVNLLKDYLDKELMDSIRFGFSLSVTLLNYVIIKLKTISQLKLFQNKFSNLLIQKCTTGHYWALLKNLHMFYGMAHHC